MIQFQENTQIDSRMERRADPISYVSSSYFYLHQFLTMSTQNIYDQLLIYVNLYWHAKNQAISLVCSEDMVD